MTIQLSLYSTSHCHLCEQAEAIIASVAQHLDIVCTVIEIADDPELLTLYEVKIPVLRRMDTNTEICWPFSIDDIYRILK